MLLPKEFLSIQGSGRYGAHMTEGKHFYPTLEQALWFARSSPLNKGSGMTLTSVDVPAAMLQEAFFFNNLPGEGPAYFFNTQQIKQLPAPTVWNYWPWYPR